MPQFLIPPGKKIGDLFSLSQKEFHHLHHVQRKRAGDKVQLTDGQGSRFLGKIAALTPQEAMILILEEEAPQIRHGRVAIAQALLKKDKMEWVVEKCVELGVDELIPFTSSRTIVQWKGDYPRERWEKIVEASVKQCSRSSLMKISSHLGFSEILIHLKSDLKIICWEEATHPIRQVFQVFKDRLPKNQNPSVLILIGPEGGFAKEEIDLAEKAGFVVASLGQKILRAETAAIATATLVQYELGNLL